MHGVGARIRERCRDLGISEAEAARRSGISARRFSFYVNDQREPNFATLLAMCKALDVTPNYLFGIDSAPEVRPPSLGQRMQARLAELGLSEHIAACNAGVGEDIFSSYLRDRRQPDLASLVDICRVLETTPDQLLGFVDGE